MKTVHHHPCAVTRRRIWQMAIDRGAGAGSDAMKKHVRIFLIPIGSDEWMSEQLTARIAVAAGQLGIPDGTLMAS